ncbi:hypothetical protein GW933_04020 [Candidatus Falkowbacteria bacterium]|uniref:Uncharacterized protein n=1 Tax=Candidatus Buchananbacteria bacterium CG10_big_fil_rev_8_21_14_0_10_33_19 TaxID=1974525 RepID=A0A2H0W559_9BACT|nr:hypothetical protein [Candidatus Falkowbacteria bacterium]PIS06493.1 MAG: hypothetical protein COT80_00975 [Candidatus Buchananbacteria bacterium CG10_big_fil_rev_8_21_14_0_10_33_19]
MFEFASEVLTIIIALIIFIPICIKKVKCNNNQNITCLKCGKKFNCYYLLKSTGYCPSCGESFHRPPKEER